MLCDTHGLDLRNCRTFDSPATYVAARARPFNTASQHQNGCTARKWRVASPTIPLGAPDFLKEAVAIVAAHLMDAEVTAQIGAGHCEVSADRVTHRNGYRPPGWEDTGW
jgi:hypothetical protein